ncbi:MAG: peptidoglycan-N-acetylglucosamine deacetylase [Actinomycetota bacterium]|nr:peptidoglycan-N-acetylglucosamine deacetylase [Actinomycetota bacterium]
MNAPTPRRIAVVPAYNEEPMVATVLEELYPLVDELVVVDDGSTDNTRAEIETWLARGRPRCRLLVHDVNRGMSEAYLTALTELRDRLARSELHADDLVFTVDADGQHDLEVLGELVEMTQTEQLDANIARRDLSYHGPFKRTGNWVLSKWASGWAGAPLHDVESGYRIFRLGALAHALEFYSGYQYSESVEVAVVLCQLGYNVRNDHVVPVPVARSRTRLRDAAIDLAVIPVAAGRVWRRDPMTNAFRTDAIAHLSIAGVLGVLIALALQQSTDTMFTISFAALAAFGLGALLRRSVPRPSLALLGSFVALVAAWLIPQRPDPTSGIILAGVFGIGAALAAPVVRRPRPSVLVLALGGLIVVALAGSRPIVLGVAVGAVFVAAVVSRFGRFGFPRTHRLRTLALGSTLVIAVSGLTGYFGASTVGATWFGGGVVHGPRASDQVAITFDDGPDVSATPAILKILDAAKVKGSFFVVGKTLDQSPQVVRGLVADGQLVGNHSYHHDDWRWLDPRYPELERTQKAFAREIGTCPVWFRPPHGQRTPLMARVVKDHDMRMAMWDVAVSDRGKNDPNAIAAKVLASVKGGSIIDLHAGLDGTSTAHRAAVVAALPLILDGLRTRGLHPVRLDQLVGGPAYQSCDSARS